VVNRPAWWDAAVERVARECSDAERAALRRLGDDDALMAALRRQWKARMAMGEHDGEKFVRAVVAAMRAAVEHDARRAEAEAENRRLALLRRRLERTAAELLALGQFGAGRTAQAAAEMIRRTEPPQGWAPHTVFLRELRARCAGDWLAGVVGDEIAAMVVRAIYGVTVSTDLARLLRRRR
jgi:phosphate uptake regulator